MKIALLSANGLGDGLLMMILSHHLQKASHKVTFFHPSFKILSPLFPEISLEPYPHLNDFEKTYQPFDLVVLENDHSEKSWALFKLREEKKLSNLVVLFVKPYPKWQRSCDVVFNQEHSIAENLKRVCQTLFNLSDSTDANGLFLKDLTKKNLYPKRIVIHPTSKDPKRNWKKHQFIKLALSLKTEGFDPIFCVSHEEKIEWKDLLKAGFSLYVADSLVDLSQWIYESGYFIGNDSGIGHLASNVGIPTLTISGNPKRVSTWRPGWCLNKIVTLTFDLPNFKGLVFPFFDGRFRDNYWQYFIPVGKVLKGFKNLMLTHQKTMHSHDAR